MSKKSSEKDNDWAKNVKQEPIHIENAPSGKKGYYCMGCGKEMVAVKKKNPNHRSYFRHWAKDVDRDLVECVVASKVYRERLAEQILHRLKSIPVPPLFKYPPKGVDGSPMLLKEKEFITAHTVKSQITFYEDDLGNICSGKNPQIDERYLLIRPDVTFFNKEGKAILFIEFVINNKPSDEKRLKLQRLGIDTIQIIIPKKPEPEIENTLKSIRSTKWVYNGKEANTAYVSPPEGNRDGVLEIDEHQRKLFEESYNCRAAEIAWLIRSIRRIVEAEPYRRTEQLFEQEISRITAATDTERAELERLEKGIKDEIRGELQTKFAVEEAEIGRRNGEFRNYRKSIEDWYSDERTRCYREESELEEEERKLAELVKGIAEPRETEDAIKGDFAAQAGRVDREIKSITGRISGIKEEEARIEGEIRALESKIRNFEEYAREEEGKIEREFEVIQIETAERISKRDAQGDPELSERIEAVLSTRGISRGFGEKQNSIQGIKEALEFIRGGTWKA